MKVTEIITEAATPAQQAAIAISMKKAGKKPKNESTELEEEFDLIESIIERLAAHNGVDAEVIWEDLETLTEDELYAFAVTSEPIMESQGMAEGSLEEIDRRGFLKGAGAAAVAGAAGYKMGQPDTSKYKNPKIVFLIGYLHAAKEYMPQDEDTLEINTIIEDYLDSTNDNATDLYSGSGRFFSDVGRYNEQNNIGRPGYTEVFPDDVKQKKWITSQGKTALRQLKTLLQQSNESVEQGMAEDWQKANKRDKTDGMSQKAVNAYRRENPGSKLKTAVTTKPSKLKKGGKASKRRKSYCSRSRGQMKMHSISCAKTPDKAICKARRRWNC